jgi:hypothetical protein
MDIDEKRYRHLRWTVLADASSPGFFVSPVFVLCPFPFPSPIYLYTYICIYMQLTDRLCF